MKSCQFENLLVPYVQQELSKSDRQDLLSHLSTCQSCRHALEDLHHVHRLLKNYEREAAPRAIYDAYMKQLRIHFAPEPLWKRSMRRLLNMMSKLFLSPSPSFRLVRAIAILIIGVLVGRTFFYPSQRVSVDSRKTQQVHTTLTKDDIQFITDYVVKSELLLLTIANSASDQPSDDDIYFNKDIAQNLLYKTAQVQRKAQALDDDVILTFLNHLELVLLEISNRKDDEIRATFRDIKELVNETELVRKSRRLQQRLESTLSESA